MATILVTGAAGFVGSHVEIALAAAGHTVRCATRSVAEARARHPDRAWVELDLERPDTLHAALAGCDAALFLVHGMSDGRDDYPDRERREAEAFARAASAAGVARIVYLGGVMPARDASRHLASRARVGAILRGGAVDTIELRAAMIIGAGSSSWTMVHDLAKRLPAMMLPRWLRNVSFPIAIEDVVAGLVAALALPARGSRVLELPGPERVCHRDLIVRVARALGHHPRIVDVPVLTPRLSSYWIALVTRTSLAMAQELVEGVRHDLVPTGEPLWTLVDHQPMSLDAAIAAALRDDTAAAIPSAAMSARLARLAA
jgi:uncharacterized protein YbjT (DUF2867 family)|nr:NAD(P)H-binding protein [Kofleriaceae bacterium]